MSPLPQKYARAPRPFVVNTCKCVITTCFLDNQPHAQHKQVRSRFWNLLPSTIQIHRCAITSFLQSASSPSSTAPTGIFRRDLLLTLAASVVATLGSPKESSAAENAAVTSSLGRYVKRKKLDRIDSYVAPLLNAREQLIRIGRVMGKKESLFISH